MKNGISYIKKTEENVSDSNPLPFVILSEIQYEGKKIQNLIIKKNQNHIKNEKNRKALNKLLHDEWQQLYLDRPDYIIIKWDNSPKAIKLINKSPDKKREWNEYYIIINISQRCNQYKSAINILIETLKVPVGVVMGGSALAVLAFTIFGKS